MAVRERTQWHHLPPDVQGAVRAAVEPWHGQIEAVRPIPDGLTCATAMVLETATSLVFVKGSAVDDAEAREAQQWEQLLNPAVRGVSPRLQWTVGVDGWEMLGFDYVPGRHADLSRRDDQAKVATVLQVAQSFRAPAGVDVPRFADRFAGHLDPRQLILMDGDTLLHTDTNPHNLLVDTNLAWLVDWAMPAVGPAWVDVAYTAVRLLEADCSAGEALAWADRFPCWRDADRAAVEAFVTGACRTWEALAGPERARSSNERFGVLLQR